MSLAVLAALFLLFLAGHVLSTNQDLDGTSDLAMSVVLFLVSILCLALFLYHTVLFVKRQVVAAVRDARLRGESSRKLLDMLPDSLASKTATATSAPSSPPTPTAAAAAPSTPEQPEQ